MRTWLMLALAFVAVMALPNVGAPSGPLDAMVPEGEPTMDGMVLCENGPVEKRVYDPNNSDHYIVVIRSPGGYTMAVVNFPEGPAFVSVGDKVTEYKTLNDLMLVYPKICSIPIVGGGQRT